jgi:dethiobiotin synthetase
VSTLFVTATGTDVGKTFITAGLIRHLRAAGRSVEALKPVMSGFDPASPENSDAGQLLAALGRPVTPQSLDAIAPLRFAAPLAPDMAARREGRLLDLEEILLASHARIAGALAPVIIEGVGGVMSPVAEDATCLDWIVDLGGPALLVTGSYLGAISHALTAASVLQARGVAIAAVVVNESLGSTVPLALGRDDLARFLPGLPLLACPRGAQPDDPIFAEIAQACGL